MIIMLSLNTNLSICKSYYSAIDIFLMLYIIPLWLVYFLTRGFYLLIPFTSLAQPSKLLPFGDHQFAFCTFEPVSALLCLFLCFLYSTITETLCLSLTSLTIIPSGSIHIVTNGKISFLKWLSSVPLYIYINVYYIIFVHSSVDGHFSCIHILATLNNAALNIGVHIFFQISIFVFFRKIPRIRLLDCICSCCLVAKSCLTFVTPCSLAHQASLSMGFSRQEYWSGLPFPFPGDILTQGSNARLLHWQAFLYCWATWEAPWIVW